MSEAQGSVEEIMAEKLKERFPTGTQFTAEKSGMVFEVVNCAGLLLTAKLVEIHKTEVNQ